MIWVARVLGKEHFGEFGLIQSTLGVVGLMAGLGLGATATRFVAQHAGAQPHRAGRVIALVSQITWATAFVAAGVLVMVSKPLATIVLEAPHLQGALACGAMLMASDVMRGVQSGIIAAMERFDFIARLSVMEGLVSMGAMLALSQSLGVTGAILGLSIGSLCVLLAGRLRLKRILRTRGIVITHRGCWQEWQILHGYSLPSLLSNLVATPVLWYCMTFTAALHGYAEIGIYNAAYQWHGPLIFIPMTVVSVTIPVLVQEWENGRRARFRKITLWNLGLTLACALPPVLLIAVMSHWIMGLYGAAFQEGWLILVLLVCAAPMHALAKIASGALFGMNRAWWVLGANLLWGATMLALTVRLTPAWGVTGLAIAFLLAYFVLAALTAGAILYGSRKSAIDFRSHNSDGRNTA
jgi:O-antigen/teichoic acid export membrane protein